MFVLKRLVQIDEKCCVCMKSRPFFVPAPTSGSRDDSNVGFLSQVEPRGSQPSVRFTESFLFRRRSDDCTQIDWCTRWVTRSSQDLPLKNVVGFMVEREREESAAATRTPWCDWARLQGKRDFFAPSDPPPPPLKVTCSARQKFTLLQQQSRQHEPSLMSGGAPASCRVLANG